MPSPTSTEQMDEMAALTVPSSMSNVHHRGVRVHRRPLGDARHRRDEQPSLQDERFRVVAFLEPHQEVFEQVHLQKLLRLQAALLGHRLNLALEARVASSSFEHLQIHPELFLYAECRAHPREALEVGVGS